MRNIAFSLQTACTILESGRFLVLALRGICSLLFIFLCPLLHVLMIFFLFKEFMSRLMMKGVYVVSRSDEDLDLMHET